ncbi:MAG: hypothetical protein AB7I27_14335 [Bacteriovoracaceae bacterium]
MQLITMAHFGEAQGVIEEFSLKRMAPFFYEGEDICLALTGEGPFEASTLTGLSLGKKTFTKIINLGIAGTLDDKLNIGEIYPVRSHFLFLENKMAFKSFKGNETGVDCLTTFDRILNPEKVAPLKGMAKLVDRESWGVAFTAKSASIPFQSHKLISDIAGTIGACELVKGQSQMWSEKLANYLEDILRLKQEKKDQISLPGFYFTFTMEHQFNDLIGKLAIKENKSIQDIIQILPLQDLLEEKILPKDRATKLLVRLSHRLDPIKAKVDEQINKWKKQYEVNGIQIIHDPSLEDDKVKIQFQVESDQALDRKINSLKNLSLSPYQNILKGQIDVE